MFCLCAVQQSPSFARQRLFTTGRNGRLHQPTKEFTLLRTTALAASIALAFIVTACGSDTTEKPSTKATDTASASPATTSATPDPKVALKKAVQGYSDKFLDGDIAAYDDYFSKGCKAKVERNYFLGILMTADQFGGRQPIKTFDATITGTSADVSYTFPNATINQSHETWILEGSDWKTTDC